MNTSLGLFQIPWFTEINVLGSIRFTCSDKSLQIYTLERFSRQTLTPHHHGIIPGSLFKPRSNQSFSSSSYRHLTPTLHQSWTFLDLSTLTLALTSITPLSTLPPTSLSPLISPLCCLTFHHGEDAMMLYFSY